MFQATKNVNKEGEGARKADEGVIPPAERR